MFAVRFYFFDEKKSAVQLMFVCEVLLPLVEKCRAEEAGSEFRSSKIHSVGL